MVGRIPVRKIPDRPSNTEKAIKGSEEVTTGRDMTREIEIDHPDLGTKIVARVLDDKNPEVCNQIWNSLPIETVWTHCGVTGQLLYCSAPIIVSKPAKYMVNIKDLSAGVVTILGGYGGFALIYGAVDEPLLTIPWAQVKDEDLNKLEKPGNAVWESMISTKEPIRVVFKRREGKK
jgi:hypothetical protein